MTEWGETCLERRQMNDCRLKRKMGDVKMMKEWWTRKMTIEKKEDGRDKGGRKGPLKEKNWETERRHKEMKGWEGNYKKGWRDVTSDQRGWCDFRKRKMEEWHSRVMEGCEWGTTAGCLQGWWRDVKRHNKRVVKEEKGRIEGCLWCRDDHRVNRRQKKEDGGLAPRMMNGWKGKTTKDGCRDVEKKEGWHHKIGWMDDGEMFRGMTKEWKERQDEKTGMYRRWRNNWQRNGSLKLCYRNMKG